MMRLIILIVISMSVAGCSDSHFEETKPGEFHGKLIVQWFDKDKFIYTPDEENPLRFVRFNKETIVPERMFTDGGSIPRALRILEDYSPWGYAPAFVIHDWLFHIKQCKLSGHEEYDFEETAWVMSEAMKTITLQEKTEDPEKFTVYAMFEAVRSPLAENEWESGECDPPPITTRGRIALKDLPSPIMEYVIEFP